MINILVEQIIGDEKYRLILETSTYKGGFFKAWHITKVRQYIDHEGNVILHAYNARDK